MAAAASSPSPLDFSLKPSPGKRPRLASAGSTHTSPASSPHSSHSPSSTTLPFSQATPLPPYPHFLGADSGLGPFAGLLAQGTAAPLLQPALSTTALSSLASPLQHQAASALDLQSVFGNAWSGASDPGLFTALSTLQRRRRAGKAETAPSADANADAVAPVAAAVTPVAAATPSPKKQPQGVPDEKKDALYWERRRKNNEAAKRSRDSRRRKEEEVALRAALLEQENLKLRAQVAVLKNEMAKLHHFLFSNTAATPPALGPAPNAADAP